MRRGRRQRGLFVLCILAASFHVVPARAISLGGILGLNSSRAPPVARKIAEFKESFVVGGMDFSADGSQLATNAMVDGRDVHIWDWRGNAKIVRVLHKDAAAGEGNAVLYSPDGNLLAVGHVGEKVPGGIRVVRIWDTRSGDVVHDVTAEVGGSGFSLSLAFSPDGKDLYRTVEGAGDPGDYVISYSADTWQRTWGLQTLPLIPRRLALSHDGKLLALGGEADEIHGASTPPFVPNYPHSQIVIVDIAKREVIRTIDQAFPNGSQIFTLSWRPDDKALAAGIIVGELTSGADAVRILDPATGRRLAAEPCTNAYVSALSYSPDGRYLIEGYIDGKVRIWDGLHTRLIQSIPVNDHAHTILAISRDRRHVAIAGGKHVSIWELK